LRSNHPWERVDRLLALCFCLMLGVFHLVTTTQPAGAQASPQIGEDATTAPSLWLSPLEIHFGSVALGQTAVRVVSVRNLGNAPLEIGGGAVDAPFAVDHGACAGGLAGGASCEIVYSFSPKSAGDYTATSAGPSNAGPWAVALRGRGAAPELQVNPRSLDFGRGPVGGEYPEQIVTIVNVGSVPAGGFSAGKVNAPFVGGLGSCTGILLPGDTCRMSFDYSPQEAGVFHLDWTINSDAGPIVIEMQGRTYSGIDGTGQGVTPRAIDFGPVPIGRVVEQTITFRNHDPSIPIVNWEYWWDDASGTAVNFSLEDDCGEVLAGHGVCQVTIIYRPRHVGDEHAVLYVLNSQGITDIELWGEGASAEIVADSPAIDLGLRDGNDEQEVHFTNLGRAPAELLGLQSAAGFAVVDSDCGDRLAPGDSCQAVVRFEAQDYGHFEGTISLMTEDAAAPVRVVGGTATPQLVASFAPDTVARGAVATLRLTIANPNTARSLFDVGIDGQLPQGLMLAAAAPRISSGCGQPQVVADPGVSAFALDDATLLAGETCVLEVDVLAVKSGNHYFAGGALSDAGPSTPAGATLRVTQEQIVQPFQLFMPTVIE